MIKAILIDDEVPAIRRLEKILKETGKVNIEEVFTNPIDVLNSVTRVKPDVIFLDIEMPEINGIELAERILEKTDNDTDIVFITAFNEYAVNAFELNAIDYLLKPVSRQRVNITLERIIKRRNLNLYKERVAIKVLCFDGFNVIIQNEDEKKIEWRTKKAEEIFAYFIHNKDKPISKDKIIELLWGEIGLENAKANLYTNMYYIRRILKEAIGVECIKGSRGYYQIQNEDIYCDYYQFEEIINRYTKDTINKSNIKEIKEAIKLYTGDYLKDMDYIWADGKRIDLENNYINIMYKLSEYHIKESKHDDAINCLKEIIKINPIYEDAYQMLIKIYLNINDRVSALKIFNKLKKELNEELGIRPGKTIEDLIKDKQY